MPARPLICRLLACAALLAGASAALAASEPPARRADKPLASVAVAADLSVEGGKTRLAITLSQRVEARAAGEERADRVIFDLREVNCQLPPGSGSRREGVVASYRYGLFAPR